MFFKKCYDKVVESDQFKKWQKDHKNHFLLGFFCMADTKEDFEKMENWSVDFFSMDKNVITTFKDGAIEESKLLDKTTVVTPFELEDHELLSPDQIVEKSKITNYNKIVAVVRERENGPIVSLKFIVVPLKLLHIEMEAVSGNITFNEEQSLLDLAKSIEKGDA